MYFGLNNHFLYTAYRIETEFKDSIGKKICGTGTAFFLEDDTKVHLVTNRHVIDLNYKNRTSEYRDFRLYKVLVIGKLDDPTTLLPDVDQKMEIAIQNLRTADEENDIAIFYGTQSRSLEADGSKHNIRYPIPIGLLADEDKIKSGLQIGDFVGFPGFPEWYDTKSNRPILRLGTIASDPRYSYSNNSDVNGDCIAYEAFSYGGSSGSPVFALQRGLLTGDVITSGARQLLLVGINAGHLQTADRMHHSGISYLYKSSKILDLIKQG